MSASRISETPLVSVIVPTYNRPALLERALRSVFSQTFSNFEVIIVNDAGADVEPLLRRLPSDHDLRYLAHPANRGPAAARNTGIRAARGDYIAYLDDDDIYYPEHLQALVDFLRRGVFSIAYTDACRAWQVEQEGEWVTTARDIPYSWEFDADDILESNHIPTLCVMHERRCIDGAGMFDETLPALEDLDLWIRMSRKYAFAHIPQVTCEFSCRGEADTLSNKYGRDFSKILPTIYSKYELDRKDAHYRKRIKELEREISERDRRIRDLQVELERMGSLLHWCRRKASRLVGRLLRIVNR